MSAELTRRGVILGFVWDDAIKLKENFSKLAAFSNKVTAEIPEKLAHAEVALSYYDVPEDIKEFMKYCKTIRRRFYHSKESKKRRLVQRPASLHSHGTRANYQRVMDQMEQNHAALRVDVDDMKEKMDKMFELMQNMANKPQPVVNQPWPTYGLPLGYVPLEDDSNGPPPLVPVAIPVINGGTSSRGVSTGPNGDASHATEELHSSCKDCLVNLNNCQGMKESLQKLMDQGLVQIGYSRKSADISVVESQGLEPLEIPYQRTKVQISIKKIDTVVFHVPAPFSFKSTKEVPWNYLPTVSIGGEPIIIVEPVIDNIVGIGGMTRSGRVFSPDQPNRSIQEEWVDHDFMESYERSFGRRNSIRLGQSARSLREEGSLWAGIPTNNKRNIGSYSKENGHPSRDVP
ncbi:unnamed protein product [Trifolium pratense]|uniref:Uncharacterized protein n=1 Tax=Trifolium pratense TaxID=57577 RepID=A0ACB0L1E5_TRIPR|nr:unnamed protein product [Trifolium pratense]